MEQWGGLKWQNAGSAWHIANSITQLLQGKKGNSWMGEGDPCISENYLSADEPSKPQDFVPDPLSWQLLCKVLFYAVNTLGLWPRNRRYFL
jgi:hypothetical protein